MFSNATWAALAHEYDEALTAPNYQQHNLAATRNAQDLVRYVTEQTTVLRHPDDPQVITDVFGSWSRRVPWVPVEDDTPYVDYDHMVTCHEEALQTPLKMQVSDLHHDHPVFSREDNLRFRVWHDTAHLQHGFSFSDEDEVELFKVQARLIGRPDQSTATVDALFCESVYQLAWCRVHGAYPDHQVVRTPGPVARALLDAWGL